MSSIKYLDKDGLTTVWGKIKGIVPQTDSSISAGSTSSNVPTSAAVASFVEGKGYVTSNTTYTISISGNVITLTDSNGGTSTATLPVYNGGVS